MHNWNNDNPHGFFFHYMHFLNFMSLCTLKRAIMELTHTNKGIQKLTKSQLQQWIADLLNFIKAYLPVSIYES